MKKLVFSLMIIFLVFSIQSKVLLYTYAYNRPDFIEIQHKTFKKFLKDEYEFVVFNDANTLEMVQKIAQTCKKLGIECIRIPQEIHDQPYLKRWPGESYHHPAVRNCNVVQYSLDQYGFNHDDILVLLDSDVFLIKEFDIRNFMHGYDIAGLGQSKAKNKRYLWIGLVFLNMPKLPNKRELNFNCGKVDGVSVDAGGHSYYYLQKYPQVMTNFFGGIHVTHLKCDRCQKNKVMLCKHNTQKLKKCGFVDHEIQFIQTGIHNAEFFLNNSFLHYRGGTNWDCKSSEYHRIKTHLLNNFINEILQ